MGYEATGRIHFIGETKQVTERLTKREFVLELADNPKYPQLVQFEITKDRCSQLDGIGVGDEVRVEFSIRGRKWDGPNGVRYFVSLDVWRVEPKGDRRTAPKGAAPETAGDGGTDDLPFATADMAYEPSPISRVLR